MEYRILGPVEVRQGGKALTISAHRERAVLATLLVEMNRVVPVERVIRSIWGDHAPATARTQVHYCISVLRKRLAPADPIVTSPPGYRLAADEQHCDAAVFEAAIRDARQLVEAGEPGSAAERLRTALSLWRGPAFGGLGGPVLDPEARRLEERRLHACEDLAGIELMLGRHIELVPELWRRVADQPLRERSSAQLMLALYRCGRQSEALEVYRRTRAALVEEQGLEPGPELQRLERRILTADPSLTADLRPTGDPSVIAAPGPTAAPDVDAPTGTAAAATAAVAGATGATAPVAGATGATAPVPPAVPPPVRPSLLPPPVRDFTGRAELVHEARRELLADGLGMVAVSGPGGIGKSTFAIHVAHRVRDHFPDGQLYVDLRGMRPETVSPMAALGQCLRALGLDDNAQAAELDERAAQYRSLLADRRILVVLDDARSAAQVRPLLPAGQGCAAVVTSRTRLDVLEGAVQVRLPPLTEAEAASLLTAAAGAHRAAAEPAAIADLARLCGNLPLAVRIIGARLAGHPQLPLEKVAGRLSDELSCLDELAIDDLAVRANLALSYRLLPAPARRLIRGLALLDAPDFAAWVASAILDAPARAAERQLETLVDACLVEEIGIDAAGQQRHRLHSLVRVFARERASAEDPAARRDAVRHRVLAAWLALAEQADQLLPNRTLAAMSGTGRRRWSGAFPEALVADPVSWFAAERTALTASVRQAVTFGLDETAWNLATAAQTYDELHNVRDDALECHLMALAACRSAGNRRGEAVMLRNLADVWTARPGANRRDKLAWATSAVELLRELDEPAGLADALRLGADVHRNMGRYNRAVAWLTESLAAARTAGHRLGEFYALTSLTIILRDQGRLDIAREYAERHCALAREICGPREQSVALSLLAVILRELRDFAGSAGALREALEISRANGDRVQETYDLARLGQTYVRSGDPSARPTIERCLRRSRQLGLTFAEALGLASLGELDLAEGRAERSVDQLTRALAAAESLESAFVRAQTLVTLGHAKRACGALGSAREHWCEARTAYARIGNRPAVEDLDALIGALPDGTAPEAHPASATRT